MGTNPDVCLGARYPNSEPRSSGKAVNSPALVLAAEIARALGMVPTWPNVQTIRLAIESEADFSGITVSQAAAILATAAHELNISGSLYTPPDWRDVHRAYKANRVDRFWFEDARWRMKPSYEAMIARLQESAQ